MARAAVAALDRVPQRLRLQVRGLVQGVGFRPHVHRLACALELAGFVRNDGAGVTIEVQGPAEALASFCLRLVSEAPAAASIEAVDQVSTAATQAHGFRINDSEPGTPGAVIGPDTGLCPQCLAELFDPSARRYRHPFIHCTQCGPRYSVSRALPYDRTRTSMAAFAPCGDCAREYADPRDRRFHAETIACPACGPRLWLAGADGAPLAGSEADPIAASWAALAAGRIVALKGLGGFQLAADARQPAAVARLRARKRRGAQAFALMFANSASVARVATVDAAARAALEAPERPIVLLPRRADAEPALEACAPGLAELGCMLPASPLHWLLFCAAAGWPAGSAWLTAPQPTVLVMTSGNAHGEPLYGDNAGALAGLAEIADCWLLHDRDIEARSDDSLLRPGPAGPMLLRRARGYSPRPITLSHRAPAVLAFGAHYKNTVALTRGDQAWLSPHLGGLDDPGACAFQAEAVERLIQALGQRPERVAHDLHPDYHSSRAAAEFATRHGLPRLAVQHHHAHVAAVLAEHRHPGPALGLALDGVGLGDDGRPWGGELLWLRDAGYTRVGHLRPLPRAGGERAAREPWRMAAAVLQMMGRGQEIATRFADQPAASALAALLARTPADCTSLGRWFDAAAGLLGICARMSYEAEAALRLQACAQRASGTAPGAPVLATDQHELDLLPLLASIADETDARTGAARFHAGLIRALADWAAYQAHGLGLHTVALSGGCLANPLLAHGLFERLSARGLQVLLPQRLPPGDGAIALGQAWVAGRCA